MKLPPLNALRAFPAAAKRLVIPFRKGLDTGRRYWLVWPARPIREPAKLLRDWLLAAFRHPAASGPRADSVHGKARRAVGDSETA